MRQHPGKSLPLMLSTLQYLDFTSKKKYLESLNKLVKKIKLKDELFTGERLYKNVDAALTGQMVGVGPIKQVPHHGSCERVFFNDGLITTMETITDGKEDGTKSVLYDDQNRVTEIILFRNNKVIDSWRYVYDKQTGKRLKKLIAKPGQKPHLELIYNSEGERIAENAL